MDRIIIPKLSTDYLDIDHKYQLIIQNQYNKELIIYNVEDLNIDNPLRFMFDISKLKSGNYKYYLVANNDWKLDELDEFNIYKSKDLTKKGALQLNGNLLVFEDKLLVLDRFSVAELISNDSCESEYTIESVLVDDDNKEGDIVNKCIHIIARGLINVDKDYNEVIEYNNKEKYIEYEG